ncbi:MAG: MFS transporter [Microbacteriaceae bacterium]|nr:MFS transporter [Microbacteriaceae bacterium]
MATTGAHRTFVDLTPLRVSPAFARLWAGQSISGVGAWLTMTAVTLLIFDITGSTLLVALVGPISLIPMIVAGLWGGMLVDALDRRAVAIATAVVSWLSTLALLGFAWWDAMLPGGERIEVWPLYVVTTVNAVASTINSAARTAIIPRIVPEQMVSRAAALNGVTFGLQLAVGPALAGVLIALVGYPVTFAIDAVLFTAGFLGIVTLPRLPPLGEAVRPGWRSMFEGFAFLRRAPVIRMSFIVDLVAMTLGRPHALFPAIGVVAVGGGEITVGVLTAAMAVGTFLAGVFSGPVARIHRQGVAVSRAIMGYGAFTILFGLVIGAAMLGWFGPVGPHISEVSWPALVLAFVALAGTGITDEFSAIFRTTMMLTAVPDDMRGRTQGVFIVVVTGGPRIGDLVAGGLATVVALAVPPRVGPDALWAGPLIGGIAIVVIIWALLRASTAWRAYDARAPRA